MGGGEPIDTFEDWHAINALLMTYAEHVDAGRCADGRGDVRARHLPDRASPTAIHVSSYEGAQQVQGFCEQTRLYPDGTPRTKHVFTNVAIDADGDRAERPVVWHGVPTDRRAAACSRSRRAATSTGSSGSAACGGSPTA